MLANGTTRENAIRSSVWAMENLVGNGRLCLGIPDTILFYDGAPRAWLFTSRAGVVMKKRSLSKSRIKERFIRLSVANPNNPQQRVATVRFMDGTVRNLRKESFKEFVAKFPATEPGVVCMQCYIQGKGSSCTVFRNSYRVVNDKALAVRGTNSFTTSTSDQAGAPVSTWSECEIKLEKSNASSINMALDEVTLTVVRFLQAEQDRPARVLQIFCDYVVDIASQIWLTWIGEVTLATADAAQDLRLASVRTEGPRGRGEFLGIQTALAMQRNVGGAPAPTRRTRRPGARSDPSNSRNDYLSKDMSNIVDRAAEAVELPRHALGGGSGGIADVLAQTGDPSRSWVSAESSLLGLPTEQRQQAPMNTVLSTMTVGVRASESAAWESRGRAPGDTYYPSSFACAGDYCTIRVLVSTGVWCSHALIHFRHERVFCVSPIRDVLHERLAGMLPCASRDKRAPEVVH